MSELRPCNTWEGKLLIGAAIDSLTQECLLVERLAQAEVSTERGSSPPRTFSGCTSDSMSVSTHALIWSGISPLMMETT